MTSYRKKRLVSAFGASAVGLTILLANTPLANAAPEYFGNIDFTQSGSLTVHKYLHQDGSVVGDPSTAPAAGAFTNPVAGVEFTAYPLLQNGTAVDLTQNTAWDALSDLVPGAGCTAPAGYTLGTGIVLPATDAAGAATAATALGAYQVCETNAPADIVDRALPFILTIPLPHENGWVYNVHAYPKNGKGEIIKTIEEQQDTGLGSIVKFPVTVPVPQMAQEWTGFAITDTLDDRLAVEGSGLLSVEVDGASLDPSYYEVTNSGQTVSVKFTAAGVAWLNQGPNTQAGKKITAVFQGKVTALGAGSIPNTAQLWTNNPNLDPSVRPPLPSNEVKTNWGSLEVLKRATGTTGTDGLLAGAVFEVYNAADPYAADCSTAVRAAGSSPVAVNNATQFTSGSNGVISIPGLFVSDSENPVVNATQRCYVLVEVAAPSGYVLPTDADTAAAVKIGQTTTSDNVEIVNTQQEVPELPLTGAAGTVILAMIGVTAILLAMVLMLVARRRDTATQ
jgi:fimbrial isopeptide formation D2 family protein/LPXTG-motif cell wall-anchored protein